MIPAHPNTYKNPGAIPKNMLKITANPKNKGIEPNILAGFSIYNDLITNYNTTKNTTPNPT